MSRNPAPRSTLLWLALCFLAIAGCGTCHPPVHERVECPVPVLPVRDADACADWRWIAVQDEKHAGSPCPTLEGWAERHLFCPGRRERPASADCESAALPPGLQPYCLYEHPQEGADLTALLPPDRLQALGLAAIARDCMAVVPQGSELAHHFLTELQDQFLSQAGQPVQLPAGATVRLAVVDTAPTDADDPQNGPFNSPHGYTLANMARGLLCDPVAGLCPFRVTAQLALAYLTFDPRSAAASVRDEVKGGYVGLVAELAEAIRKETVAWQASGEEHLVLNLAVGWRREVGGPDPPANQAVRAALRDAHCRGALAVAAAGNRDWGPEEKLHAGPLLPALWEGLPAPTVAECTADLEAGATRITDGPAGAYRPFLAAVGAVDAGSRALANARFAAEPRLVAFGDHGVVESPVPSEPTAVLTGSSVPTLVVSATAAALWSADPRREPGAVLDQLYREGRDLGRRADFCQGDGPADSPQCADAALTVHRVYLCTAVGRECRRRSSSSGPAAPGSPAAFPGEEVLRLKLGDLPGFAGAPVLDARNLRRERRSAACPPPWAPRYWVARPAGEAQERLFRSGPEIPLYPCPLWQLPGIYAQAALGPQPGSDPCPPCEIGTGSPGTLVIEIDPQFRGRLSSAVLKVGNATYGLDLPTPAPPRAIVENVPYEPGEEVLLAFVLDGNRSAVSAILVAERAPPE